MNATIARPSVNRTAAPLVASLLERRSELRLDVRRHDIPRSRMTSAEPIAPKSSSGIGVFTSVAMMS